ncbi:MAG: 30S ribosomal protein S4 [Actinomycetota bacterium]
MARVTGSVCRYCRRAMMKLYLKGEKCFTDKCPVSRRMYPPGEHGRRYVKESEYSLRLHEKQKARRMYGILEGQFRNYYELAARQKGVTGENLLRLLETRLDNVVYRLGLGRSRSEARQLVGHGQMAVNGKRVDIPSFRVKQGDVISLTSRGGKLERIKESAALASQGEVPAWLEMDFEKIKAKVKEMPAREDIVMDLSEQLIVEFYSK